MISSKSLELTNYIDPELTWKTVSKGYRRSTRRSRKLIDRSSKFDADLGDGETEDMSETTVSESEKLGVAVLGQRFGDKIEHVPIKKRFMVRSLSPPPCFSFQYPEKMEQLKNVPNPTDRKSFPKLTTKRQVIAINPKEIKPDYGVDDRVNDVNLPEDFSGIEILAAAACNNIVSGDVGNIEDPIILEKSSQDERDLSQSVMSMKAVASLEASHSSPIHPVHEDTKDSSHLQDKAVEGHLKHEDSITEERHVSSRDSRLHWDLNVAMDAWGQPCDAADSETDTVQDIHNEKMPLSEPCGEQNKSKDRSDIGSPLPSVIDNQEHGLEANFVSDRIEEICIPTVKAVESLIYAGIVAKPCSRSDVDASISHSSEQRSKSFMVSGLAYETGKAPVAVFVNAKITEVASAVLPSESTLDEKGPDAFLCAEEGTACAVDSILPNGEEDELSGIESNMHEDVKCPLKMGSGPGSYEHKPMNNGEEAGVSHTKLNSEDFCSSVTSKGDCPLVSTMNKVNHIDDVNVARIVDSAEVMHSSSENSTPNVVEVIGASYLCRKQGDSSASSLGRVTMEDNYDDNYDFAFSEKNQRIGHVNDMDEADYDSQYEDGELRETDVPYWGNNACEDDEAECVDYGSDTCDNNDVVKVLSQGSDSVLEKYAIAGTGDGEAKAFESNQLLGSEISSNRSVQTIEKCTTRKYTSGCLDGFDEKDSRVRLASSRASRMELSRSERSLSSDTLLQKDGVYFKRSGNLDSCNQPDQAGSDHSVNKDRCDSQMADRSAQHIHISNSSDSLWDLKHHESAIRHGCFGSGYTRPKSVVENRGYAIHSGAPAGVVRDGKHVDRQAMPSSSGLCRPLFRRRSPCSKDDTDHMHRGFIPARDMSPGGRSFRRYPLGVNRGYREEYQRPFSNYSEKCFNHVPNRMLRREHNSSPPNRAPAYYRRPYKRSQSRSRSRSPVPWFLHKERDDALKHRSSRSPDYRLEARIERTRLPFQKHSFQAKYNLNLLSPPKRCFSPQHNSCWFDDPNGSGHFRGRRLPGSTFQQNQRFESVGPSRRLNSDGYFEPNMRAARFAEMGRGGRMHRYDGSDEERKRHEGRYDIKRVRRYDSDGAVRQFRHNEEESFMSRSKHNDCDGGGSGKRPRVAHQEESVMKRKVN